MTTVEKATLQKFVNQFSDLRDAADSAFKELQRLNKDTSGTAWCCAFYNYRDLVETSKKPGYTNHLAEAARKLYEQYVEANAKQDLMRDLMNELADMNFWKEK